jgi:hypothetical protein
MALAKHFHDDAVPQPIDRIHFNLYQIAHLQLLGPFRIFFCHKRIARIFFRYMNYIIVALIYHILVAVNPNYPNQLISMDSIFKSMAIAIQNNARIGPI